ncbi:MAG: phytoene desaturase family protein [Bacteroidetes bacterium]|nr:phytoene desaturase family protein [Bacteroidota bacterium]MDA0903273.1 phytoene desaturase family protein [Bacteroidota bacterium]MDA1242168.1 phytoene desaturase family protein [Bacteroidota bacterium]
MSESRHVVVVGAGVGGLATAVRMAARGHRVTVLESAPTVGGKLAEHLEDGHRFDRGPSLFTMPSLMVELDELVPPHVAGRPAPFRFDTMDRSTHYFWEDEVGPLIAWSDNDKFARDVEARWGVPAKQLQSHLRRAKEAFELTRGVFLERSLHERSTYLTRSAWRLLSRVGSLPLVGTLNRYNTKHLGHPKLRQLFNRYATYNGSDPHKAPAMLHVIPHLEHGIGTYLPHGGMRSIPLHLQALARSQGVTFRTDCGAAQILHDGIRVTGVLDVQGATHPADVVVSNVDLHPTYRNLLPDLPAPERILNQERSTSGVIFYWGVRGSHPQLHLHNILFSKDYETEFDSIQHTGSPGQDPTVYINITSKIIPDDAPTGHENWFVLTNVGANPRQWDDAAVAQLRQAVLAKVSRTLGFVPDIVCEQVLTPQIIESSTGSWMGALYGASSNSAQAAFLRHRNRSTQLRGLYFCGGSVHPGGGIPLCLLGARIVDELVNQ